MPHSVRKADFVTCTHCKTLFVNQNYLDQHQQTTGCGNPSHYCSLCKALRQDPEGVKMHMTIIHVCPVGCLLLTKSRKEKARHQIEEGHCYCEKCDLVFETKESFEGHFEGPEHGFPAGYETSAGELVLSHEGSSRATSITCVGELESDDMSEDGDSDGGVPLCDEPRPLASLTSCPSSRSTPISADNNESALLSRREIACQNSHASSSASKPAAPKARNCGHLQCQICGAQFAAFDYLLDHLTTTGHMAACSCLKTFEDETELTSHQEDTGHHQGKPVPFLGGIIRLSNPHAWTCSCGLRVRDKTCLEQHQHLTGHREGSHAAAPSVCTICNCKFRRPRQKTVQEHIASQHAACPDCHQLLPNERSLRMHYCWTADTPIPQREREPTKTSVCPICDLKLGSPDCAQAHMYARHIFCPTCLLLFGSEQKRDAHQREKGHCYCDGHDMFFSWESGFEKHKQNSQRNYGREQLQNHSRDATILIMGEDKRLHCDECNLDFRSLLILKCHKRTIKHRFVAARSDPLTGTHDQAHDLPPSISPEIHEHDSSSSASSTGVTISSSDSGNSITTNTADSSVGSKLCEIETALSDEYPEHESSSALRSRSSSTSSVGGVPLPSIDDPPSSGCIIEDNGEDASSILQESSSEPQTLPMEAGPGKRPVPPEHRPRHTAQTPLLIRKLAFRSTLAPQVCVQNANADLKRTWRTSMLEMPDSSKFAVK